MASRFTLNFHDQQTRKQVSQKTPDVEMDMDNEDACPNFQEARSRLFHF